MYKKCAKIHIKPRKKHTKKKTQKTQKTKNQKKNS